MKEIELLEKLVEVQEMHIELINDYRRLQNCYQDLEHIKNVKIDDLNNTIEGQSEEIGALRVENEELKKQIADLKNQIEILQQALVTVETPEEENK